MDQPSSAPTPATNPLPQPPQASGHSAAFLVLISLVIGLVIGACGFMVWQRMAPKPVLAPTPTETTTGTNEGTATSTPTTPTSTAVNIDETAANLMIAWKAGSIVTPSAAFGTLIPSNTLVVKSPSNYEGGIDEALPNYTFTYDYYEQGRVNDGAYKDWLVYGAKQAKREVDLGMDPTTAPTFFNLLVSPDKGQIRIIGMSGSPIFSQAWPGVKFAPNFKLNLSTFPTTITLENGKILTQAGISAQAVPSPICGGSSGCVDRLPIAHTQNGLGVYAGATAAFFQGEDTKPGCVILYRENGEGMAYESGIASAIRDPQVPNEPGYVAAKVVTPNQLSWNAPYANTSTFRAHEVGGCGGIGCLRVLQPDELRQADIVQAGTTNIGEPIYVYTPEAISRIPNVLNEVYEQWYEYDQNGQKPSVQVFVQRTKVPLFFWKDAFGRWVVYKNAVAVPLAECGKPVIYLYPTKTQQVQVKLPSFINVTVSEPSYPTEGWNVSAEPNGQLTLKDGSTFGSLFWEGLGVNYAAPTTGFVVKNGQVSSFLDKTLTRYGLNSQEKKEFMEFWVPRMTGAPYYRVSFLTSDWSQQVPLTVSPAPKTSIRLFMDWQRLGGPIDLKEPMVTTPSRDGFTLVEWGGLLR